MFPYPGQLEKFRTQLLFEISGSKYQILIYIINIEQDLIANVKPHIEENSVLDFRYIYS